MGRLTPAGEPPTATVLSGTAAPAPGPAPGRRRPSRAQLAWIAAYAVAGVVLFVCYLRVSATQPVSSDPASNALEAWDMLHGNPLLRGWTLTDVSFYTTELPEYMIVEVIRGLGPDVVHTAAAFTYTLLVLLAGLLAKGRATGREGVARVLIGSGIMLAPQLGNPVYVLVLVPDHVGTGVPMLAIFLILDRAPRRWFVPPLVGLMLAWATVADRLVVDAALLPILVACGVRVYQGAVRARRGLAAVWFELSLIAASLAALAVSLLVLRVIRHLGGFILLPLNASVAHTAALPKNFRITGEGLLDLYGANVVNIPLGPRTALAAVHLLGLALASWGLLRALRRFFRCDDLVTQVLALGILADVCAFVFSGLPYSNWDARQISAALPFGAALAGRVLTADLLRARLAPVLALLLACYTAALGYDAAQPAVPAHDQPLADWLAAHHLTYGLSVYLEGNVTTLASGGQVQLATVSWGPGKAVPRAYQSRSSWYDPQQHYANFVVNTAVDQPQTLIPSGDLLAAFGRPAAIYHDGPYTIMVWNKNLLADLGRPAKQGPGNIGPGAAGSGDLAPAAGAHR